MTAPLDLAVLKIEAQGLPTVEFGSSDALSVGDWGVCHWQSPQSGFFRNPDPRHCVRFESSDSISIRPWDDLHSD